MDCRLCRTLDYQDDASGRQWLVPVSLSWVQQNTPIINCRGGLVSDQLAVLLLDLWWSSTSWQEYVLATRFTVTGKPKRRGGGGCSFLIPQQCPAPNELTSSHESASKRSHHISVTLCPRNPAFNIQPLERLVHATAPSKPCFSTLVRGHTF